MKASELRDLSIDELNRTIAERRKDLYALRSKLVVGNIPNPKLINQYKKDIARCLTLITEKQLAGGAK